MSRPRIYKTQAVVLKQMPLGEADRILTLYTPDMGRVRAVAKGVRRIKSRFGGHLELLNHVTVSISYGRNLDTVNEAETINSFKGFRSDLERLSRALYLSELVDVFSTDGYPNYAVYQLLLDTLQWLGETAQPEMLTRYFELRLVELSGFRPEIYSCVECRAVLQPDNHLFNSASGGVLCPECRVMSEDVLVPLSLNTMKVLRFMQREPAYAKVNDLKVGAPILRELERLMRAYIHYIIERELKSAEFVHLVSADKLGVYTSTAVSRPSPDAPR
ncbi:MAG: DNA repair protein RecO [Chloroflexi bacterium]|nr:DNA repair protein RecO [Chloroflexota bacterium]